MTVYIVLILLLYLMSLITVINLLVSELKEVKYFGQGKVGVPGDTVRHAQTVDTVPSRRSNG